MKCAPRELLVLVRVTAGINVVCCYSFLLYFKLPNLRASLKKSGGRNTICLTFGR